MVGNTCSFSARGFGVVQGSCRRMRQGYSRGERAVLKTKDLCGGGGWKGVTCEESRVAQSVKGFRLLRLDRVTSGQKKAKPGDSMKNGVT